MPATACSVALAREELADLVGHVDELVVRRHWSRVSCVAFFDAMRVGEDLEAVAAGDRDERDAGGLRGADRRARSAPRRRRSTARRSSPPSAPSRPTRGCVSSTMPPRADDRRRATARRRACRARCGGRHPRAARRAPRPARQKAAAWTACVCAIERLARRERRERRMICAGVKVGRRRTRGSGAHRLARGSRCRTGRSRSARPACRRRAVSAAARGSASHMRSSMPASCSTTSSCADLVRRGDDALGQAEADGEILEIVRRRHHHRIGRAVIGEGDGGLLRRSRARRSVAPRRAPDRARRRDGAAGGAHRRLLRGLDGRGDAPALARQVVVLFLPLGRAVRAASPAPPSPCIPGSWSPSRKSRW